MRLVASLLAIVSAGWLAGRDPADKSADQGKEIVAQAVEALGGDRFLNFHNRSASGRLYSFFRGELSAFDRARIYVDYPVDRPANGLGIRERELFGKKHCTQPGCGGSNAPT